jgi:hypothetical protein
MSVPWTRRKNGRVMTTVRFEAHIDRELIDWICNRMHWNEAKALAWYKEHLKDGARDRQHWYAPAFSKGELDFIHVDDSREILEEGGEVYGE